MKRRIRKRRVLKWSGTIVCVGIMALWAACQRYEIVYLGGFGNIGSTTSAIFYDSSYLLHVESEGWHIGDTLFWGTSLWSVSDCFSFPRYTWDGSPWLNGNSAGYFGVHIPFWCMFAPALLVTSWLWYADRRRIGECVNCGYNLTGNVSGVCPECGATIEG
ncbi:MAG: hypothetical protein DHS20C16_05440 [Phycisphaerae bacterium]|nr:MAG: hypothetical protein DHS20C16_05440 [Phycisphaerae bacterium]